MAVKRSTPRKAPDSILHEEVHPGLTYSLVAIGAFFAGAILLGALSVHAEIDPSTSTETRTNESVLELRQITKRVERIEKYIGMKTEGALMDTRTCGRLEDALPSDDQNIQRVPDSAACFNAPAFPGSDQLFLNASAIYRPTETSDETEDVTVEIYDFNEYERAAENFLAEMGFLPIDPASVKQEDILVNGHVGSFTYENASDRSEYERGANRLLIGDRYGILVHGPAVGSTDRKILDDVTKAVRVDILQTP